MPIFSFWANRIDVRSWFEPVGFEYRIATVGRTDDDIGIFDAISWGSGNCDIRMDPLTHE